MHRLFVTTKFKKDLRKVRKRGKDTADEVFAQHSLNLNGQCVFVPNLWHGFKTVAQFSLTRSGVLPVKVCERATPALRRLKEQIEHVSQLRDLLEDSPV